MTLLHYYPLGDFLLCSPWQEAEQGEDTGRGAIAEYDPPLLSFLTPLSNSISSLLPSTQNTESLSEHEVGSWQTTVCMSNLPRGLYLCGL